MTPWLSLRTEDYLALAAVVLLPWAFGGVELWAYRSAALLLWAAAALAVHRGGWAGLGLGEGSRWLLPALLLGLWGVVQVLPLPAPLVRVLSPSADAVYRQAFPGYPGGPSESLLSALESQELAHVPEAEGRPEPTRPEASFQPQFGGRWTGWRSVSLFPTGGIERLHWYAALGVGFLLVRRRARDPDVALCYRNVLFGGFLALAVFGLIYAATPNGKLYWVRPSLEQARAFGPYLNPTNFAGVMEMATPWLIGCALLTQRRSGGRRYTELRAPMLAAAGVLCLAAGLATASKLAAILLVVSSSTLLVAATRGAGRKLAAAALIVLIALSAVGALRYTRLGERVEQFLDITEEGYGEVGRVVAWKAAQPMLADYAIAGCGYGAFREVYSHYIPAGESKRWNQLHNDYYEVLIEGGAVGAVFLVWLIGAYVLRVARGTRWRTGEGADLEALGLALGVSALFVHAFFDFNHQIPANALLFVTLAALAVAAAERGRDEREASA